MATLIADVASLLNAGACWDTWLRSESQYDKSVGVTLERQYGISENKSPEPDLPAGIELKASATHTITLFNQKPCFPPRAVQTLVGMYGVLGDDGVSRFYTNLAAGRLTNIQGIFFTLSLSPDETELWLMADDTVAASWSMEVLWAKMRNKLSRLVFAPAERKRIGDDEFLRYLSRQYYAEPSLTRFKDGLRDGRIQVHFRAKGKATAFRNHGTALRISVTNLPSLFEYGETI